MQTCTKQIKPTSILRQFSGSCKLVSGLKAVIIHFGFLSHLLGAKSLKVNTSPANSPKIFDLKFFRSLNFSREKFQKQKKSCLPEKNKPQITKSYQYNSRL
jgi:hypothetical protein